MIELESIMNYWLEALFGGFITVLGVWCSVLKKKLKEETALKKGIREVFHGMLFQICEEYIALGYIPIEDAEEIRNREQAIYEAYTALKGNGTGTDIHNRFTALPFKNPDTE